MSYQRSRATRSVGAIAAFDSPAAAAARARRAQMSSALDRRYARIAHGPGKTALGAISKVKLGGGGLVLKSGGLIDQPPNEQPGIRTSFVDVKPVVVPVPTTPKPLPPVMPPPKYGGAVTIKPIAVATVAGGGDSMTTFPGTNPAGGDSMTTFPGSGAGSSSSGSTSSGGSTSGSHTSGSHTSGGGGGGGGAGVVTGGGGGSSTSESDMTSPDLPAPSSSSGGYTKTQIAVGVGLGLGLLYLLTRD